MLTLSARQTKTNTCANSVDPNTVSSGATLFAILARGCKTFFMLNSAEHEICPASKSQITDNCKFFLAKHS